MAETDHHRVPQDQAPLPPPPPESEPQAAETPPAGVAATPRWRGYPGVPLTAAPLRVWPTLGVAAYAIALNLGLTLYLRSAPVTAAAHAAIRALVRSTGAAQMQVAAVVSGFLMVLAYALVLAPVFAIARRRRVSFSEAVGLRPMKLGPGLVVGAVAVGVAMCLVVEYGMLLTRFGVENAGNTTELIRVFGASPLGIAIVFLIGAGLAPFAEEVLFRGVVFASLRESWHEGWAILASSVLFGIIHLQPLAMIPTALIGAVLAKVFSSTRSLWASILVHAAYNTLVLTLALLTTTVAR